MQTSKPLSPAVSLPRREARPIASSPWRTLYWIGGLAALLTVVLGLAEVAIEMNSSALAGGPASASDWFALLQRDRVLGLALLEIFEVALLPLGGLMFLALYVALRRAGESLMAIALACEFLSVALFLSSNVALAMLALSDQYPAATQAQQATLLASAQVLLASWQGTGHFLTFSLGSIAGVLASLVMLRSPGFGRLIGWVGILGNVLGLPGPALGFLLWTVNGLLVLLWSILVGIRLLQLARHPNALVDQAQGVAL